MRVHYLIEYESNEGHVESMSDCDSTTPEGRQFLHALLDEYLDDGLKIKPERALFQVGASMWGRDDGVCHCYDVKK